MARMQIQRVLVAITMLVATACAAADGIESVVPQESTDRFLNRVPAYAGGQPSPSIVMPTRALGEYQNGPQSTMERKSLSASQPASHPPLSSSKLSGGTIEHRPVTPVVITSPWTGH